MSFSQTTDVLTAKLSGTAYWKKGNTLETTLANIKVSPETIKKFQNLLLRNGIKATIRKSLGHDIQGACGQLATK